MKPRSARRIAASQRVKDEERRRLVASLRKEAKDAGYLREDRTLDDLPSHLAAIKQEMIRSAATEYNTKKNVKLNDFVGAPKVSSGSSKKARFTRDTRSPQPSRETLSTTSRSRPAALRWKMPARSQRKRR